MDKSKTVEPANAATEPRTGIGTGRVTEQRDRPAELDRLNVFIGRWITDGETVAQATAPAVPIASSDVYQWVAGECFVMHPVYGRIGPTAVGGVEIIGYSPATGRYHTHFFDSQGNVATQTLSCRDGVWTWQGAHARCTGVFSADGKTLTARHERSDDGVNWTPSMNVTLRKCD